MKEIEDHRHSHEEIFGCTALRLDVRLLALPFVVSRYNNERMNKIAERASSRVRSQLGGNT